MTREEKQLAIEELKKSFSEYEYFYLADSSAMTVADVNDLRRKCFEKDIKFQVAKNTLVKKAFEGLENESYKELFDVLAGPTSLMFTTTSNAPAKVIKEFRKGHDKPLLKAAYIETAVYVGEEHLEALSKLKSKEELVGDIIGLLQSPVKNVIGALQSGGNKLSGILKTLSEKEEK